MTRKINILATGAKVAKWITPMRGVAIAAAFATAVAGAWKVYDWIYDRGYAACQAAQTKSDDKVTDAAEAIAPDLEQISADTENTKDAAKESYNESLNQIDANYYLDLGRREGRAAGRAAVLEEYADNAGGCLPAIYSDNDGMRERARSLQRDIFGDGAANDGAEGADTPVSEPTESGRPR